MLKRLFLFEPLPSGGGGGQGAAPSAPASQPAAPSGGMSVFDAPSAPSSTPPPGQQPPTSGTGTTPPTGGQSTGAAPTPAGAPQSPAGAPAPVLQIGQDELTRMIALAAQQAGANAPQPQQPQPQFTQDDFDRTFNVFKPSAQHIANILAGGDQAIAALNEIVNGVARQATTMSAYQMAELERKLEGRINPVVSHYQQQREAALMDGFIAEHKELKGFEPIIKQVVKQFQEQGAKFPDMKAAYKAVAEHTQAFIRSMPGLANWQPGAQPPQAAAAPAGQQPGQQVTPQPSGMSSLSSGGQGGAGGSPTGGGVSKSPGMAVFD